MSTPTLPPTPSEPTSPMPAEPSTPTPSEPTVPLPPEPGTAPAGDADAGVDEGADAPGADAAGAFAEEDDDTIGTAETVADNEVEEAVVDAVDPGGRPD